jgi:predicted GTPase
MLEAMERTKILIMGAAGRDFHDFLVAFRDDPTIEVVAFTATQIPNIHGRRFPAALAGPHYPSGIPIHEQSELEKLVADHGIDEVVFSYSDVEHAEVMHQASRVLASGAGFRLVAPKTTMLRSSKPVVSVCAVRTGVGKSPTTRRVAGMLRDAGLKVAVLRHPMPYGDLTAQAVQRFATLQDLTTHDCTIEEMEEYEPHILAGHVVFAGVDYASILRAAEKEADVILWDGGNNDFPFIKSDLEIALVDPHRPGDETRFHPGETNLLRADVIIVTKVDSAEPANVEAVCAAARAKNPRAMLVQTNMTLNVERGDLLEGASVLVVEDGPTTTHGGMGYGAGVVAARRQGAKQMIDPRPFAIGSLRGVFEQYPHLGGVLPAMGYGSAQVRDLEASIAAADADAVVIATPVDLRRLMKIDKPCVRVTYQLGDRGSPTLADALGPFITRAKAGVKG